MTVSEAKPAIAGERPPALTKMVLAAALVLAAVVTFVLVRFPADTTPRGAYLRIAASIGKGEPQHAFAYLEEDAQVACHTIHAYAKKATATIRKSYPTKEQPRALANYADIAAQADPPAVWALLATKRRWLSRLRRDLSGVQRVEEVGDRASIITARGTRYPFRRRPNRIWGLTMFTAELQQHARKLARDWELIQKASADFGRARK